MRLLTSTKKILYKVLPFFQPKTIVGKKILIIGLAKSGTSILMARVSHGLASSQEYFEPLKHRGQVDVGFHKSVCANSNNVVTKIIFYPTHPQRLRAIIACYDKVIWIIRDPRDNLISSFFYSWYHKHNPSEEKFKQALKLVKRKEKYPSAVPFHFIALLLNQFECDAVRQRYQKLIKIIKNLKQSIYLLRYEDLVENQVTGLNEYLGFPISDETQAQATATQVARTKTYGNWRTWFTNQDVNYYRVALRSALVALKYDPRDWKLTPIKALPAENGSQYMEKLFFGEREINQTDNNSNLKKTREARAQITVFPITSAELNRYVAKWHLETPIDGQEVAEARVLIAGWAIPQDSFAAHPLQCYLQGNSETHFFPFTVERPDVFAAHGIIVQANEKLHLRLYGFHFNVALTVLQKKNEFGFCFNGAHLPLAKLSAHPKLL